MIAANWMYCSVCYKQRILTEAAAENTSLTSECIWWGIATLLATILKYDISANVVRAKEQLYDKCRSDEWQLRRMVQIGKHALSHPLPFKIVSMFNAQEELA